MAYSCEHHSFKSNLLLFCHLIYLRINFEKQFFQTRLLIIVFEGFESWKIKVERNDKICIFNLI